MTASSPTPSPAWLLAFDASTPRCVIALGRVDVDAGTQSLVVDDDQDDGPKQASTRLMPRIESALARAGIEAADLAAVGCGRGPGTFTGTRVAVASAKGLAYGLGRPVLPLSTLACVAASADREGPVLALLDARRSEVYGAMFECSALAGSAIASVEARSEERVVALGALLESLHPVPSNLSVVGPGVEPYRAALTTSLSETALPLGGPTAKGLWAVTAAMWARSKAVHPAALEAVYLRASYAEMGINKPKRPFVKSPFV